MVIADYLISVLKFISNDLNNLHNKMYTNWTVFHIKWLYKLYLFNISVTSNTEIQKDELLFRPRFYNRHGILLYCPLGGSQCCSWYADKVHSGRIKPVINEFNKSQTRIRPSCIQLYTCSKYNCCDEKNNA